ncbi:MAG: TetR/AcrR family transcriptional regulator [Coriobacteriia bacterium]|nr:TetR/AcrR family transcriptional regulator [Coriobacteriia bacterium]
MSDRTDKTKTQLFQAALQLISEQGFAGTTVDKIVEHAGVSKGTVYYHFKGKAELVEALIDSELEPLAERFAAVVLASTDPLDRVMAFVRTELEWIRDNREFAKILVTELWREDRVWRESLVMLRGRILAHIADAILDGRESGAFPADIDPDFAASALFGMTATTALDWLVFYPEQPVEHIAGQIAALAARAVRV